MSELLMVSYSFLFGFIVGTVLMIYQAMRPNGYRANDGKRYRLTEVTRP